MTRSFLRSVLALSFVILSAADLFALPFPKATPLPEGAIRRFGQPPPKQPAKKRAARMLDDDEFSDASALARHAAMALTANGKYLIVADSAGRIDNWEIATGQLVKRLQEPGKDAIHSVAIAPNGQWLACGRTKPDIQIWDLFTGKIVKTIALESPNGTDRALPERLVFSPDSKVLYTGIDIFTGANDRGNSAWEVASGKRLWNNAEVGFNLAVDPLGRWVLTGVINSDPARLALLDAATGQVALGMTIEPSWESDDNGGGPVDASGTQDRRFTSDGSRLVSIHGDGTARVWDPLAGKELVRMKRRDRSGNPGGLACSPDGKWSALRDGNQILIWELSSGRQLYTISGLEAPARELIFTRECRGIIASAGPSPILWSLKPKDLPDPGGAADALWDALGSEDAAAAYKLQWALIGDPKAAVKQLSGRVRPADAVIPRTQFDRLVTRLDGPRFAERERAESELTRAGITVPAAWLRQALKVQASAEAQARLRRVLERVETPGPARWRLERAVQVLELAATPETRALLTDWAAGPAGAILTDTSAAALKRLGPRP